MKMTSRVGGYWALVLLLASSGKGRCEEPSVPPLALQLVLIERGNRESSFGDDPRRFQQTAVYKAGKSAGVGPRQPSHPWLAFTYTGERLFYLFYNDVVNVPEERYLIQRIKRTKINVSHNGESATTVDYQVEAMKTLHGNSKRPDQHFGAYSWGNWEKREIIKEFDVGFGEIEGLAAGKEWPFDPRVLFRQVQPYGKEMGVFEKVKFEQSLKWSLAVSIDRSGNCQLRSPELGIEVVWRLPASPGSAGLLQSGAGRAKPSDAFGDQQEGSLSKTKDPPTEGFKP